MTVKPNTGSSCVGTIAQCRLLTELKFSILAPSGDDALLAVVPHTIYTRYTLDDK